MNPGDSVWTNVGWVVGAFVFPLLGGAVTYRVATRCRFYFGRTPWRWHPLAWAIPAAAAWMLVGLPGFLVCLVPLVVAYRGAAAAAGQQVDWRTGAPRTVALDLLPPPRDDALFGAPAPDPFMSLPASVVPLVSVMPPVPVLTPGLSGTSRHRGQPAPDPRARAAFVLMFGAALAVGALAGPLVKTTFSSSATLLHAFSVMGLILAGVVMVSAGRPVAAAVAVPLAAVGPLVLDRSSTYPLTGLTWPSLPYNQDELLIAAVSAALAVGAALLAPDAGLAVKNAGKTRATGLAVVLPLAVVPVVALGLATLNVPQGQVVTDHLGGLVAGALGAWAVAGTRVGILWKLSVPLALAFAFTVANEGDGFFGLDYVQYYLRDLAVGTWPVLLGAGVVWVVSLGARTAAVSGEWTRPVPVGGSGS